MLYRLLFSLGLLAFLVSACGGNSTSSGELVTDNLTFVFFYKDG